jgi:hypothetical protein
VDGVDAWRRGCARRSLTLAKELLRLSSGSEACSRSYAAVGRMKLLQPGKWKDPVPPALLIDKPSPDSPPVH